MKELTLDGCRSITDAGLEELALLPTLERVRIERCPNISAGAISRLEARIEAQRGPGGAR